MVTIIALEPRNRRGGGTEYTHAFMAILLKPSAQRAGPSQRFIQLVAANKHIGQRGVWRIMHPTAEAQFFLIETGEVVVCGVLHRIVVLKISLQNHFAGKAPPPAPAAHLTQQPY